MSGEKAGTNMHLLPCMMFIGFNVDEMLFPGAVDKIGMTGENKTYPENFQSCFHRMEK